MDSKEYLQIVVGLRTLKIRLQSNVSDEDLLVFNSFLILLRKDGLLNSLKGDAPDIDHRLRIQECVDLSTNDEIKNLYANHIKSICERIRKLYIKDLLRIYLRISDDFIQNYAAEFFDEQLQTAFLSKGNADSSAMQPKELTDLLNSFCNTEQIINYYNPFAGLASLALKLPQTVNYCGEEIHSTTWLVGKLRMLVYDCPPNFEYQMVDSFEKWTFRTTAKYDFISFNPPFNIKLDSSNLPYLKDSLYGYSRNANSLIISETFNQLRPGGTMVFVSPNSFLFSEEKHDKALKEYFVQNGYIEKIIALPERVLNFTSLSVNIIVLNNTPRLNSKIEFINATELVNKESSKIHKILLEQTIELISEESNKLKRLVGVEEIKSNDYNLSVNRYIYDDLGISEEDKKNFVQFKNLVRPIVRKKVIESTGKLVKMRDLSEDLITFVKNFQNINISELKGFANKLENNSLLLSTTWKTLKPTLFESNSDNIYYDYNSIFACQIKEDKVDKEYFVLELSKEYVQKQIDQRRVGTAQSRITLKDLLQIKIIVPSLEVQKKRKYLYQESVINEHQAKIKELMLNYGIDLADENSFLRHQIAGTLKNLRGSFSKLKQIIEEQVINELPSLYSYKVNPKIDSTFLDYLKRIERDLNSVHDSVKSVGVELNLLTIKLQPINFIKFVSNYAEEIKNRNSNRFDIKIDIDKELLKEHEIKEVVIQGDRNFLHQAFNNIIENAERHAFSSSDKSNNRIELELIYDFEDLTVQLDFTNTGKPMPENYSYEAFTRKGSKAGANAGDGVGGWFLHEVMEKHNGKLGFTDETGREGIKGDYATTIELTFPIEIKI
ncbi:N-6 DNA methylase [Zobellia laminariae]|uniref:N-6 DNA methylase n=1 Tax=Zobellia laminariae TaxID=248906 RepID=UPI0012D8FEB6|nr:hypothetical protein [Zobellia laminariae]